MIIMYWTYIILIISMIIIIEMLTLTVVMLCYCSYLEQLMLLTTVNAIGRDLDDSTVAHSDTIINWPIKSYLENDIQLEVPMNV